jgi:predicted DsbA family dithiol-disulfide isomerase
MHDRLFANQRELTPSDLPKHAMALKLDANVFRQCLDSGRHTTGIRQDFGEGQRAGIKGTPTFFLGVEEGSKLRVVKVIRGAVPISAFKGSIEGALGSVK